MGRRFVDDDKNLVILCVTILGITAMVVFGSDALAVVNSIISGLFGLAVGRSWRGRSD